jgi:hypothetical protein
MDVITYTMLLNQYLLKNLEGYSRSENTAASIGRRKKTNPSIGIE